MNKGQITIPNVLGVVVILFIFFALREAIFDALGSAFSASGDVGFFGGVLNQIPWVTFPAFFIVVILMLIFYKEEPRYA